jgi:hypothetical protein
MAMGLGTHLAALLGSTSRTMQIRMPAGKMQHRY